MDLKRGEISFGDDAPRAIWYIGSEANASRTWLWGYENINRLDERLLTLARDVRDFGLRHGLEELSTPKLALSEEINARVLSAIACGLSQEPDVLLPLSARRRSCVCGVCGGRVRELRWHDQAQHGCKRAISLARDYIGVFQLNHAVLSGALLLRNGTKFSEAAGKIVANFKNDALFSFDNLERLSEVKFAV